MNANAIYSKSGKGVQEASGKTSNLSRPDRAVLSAIDGRATLADVAQKVGKPFDPAFEKLIETLDKNGYVREVSPGTAPPPKPGAAKPAGKPSEPGSDLDFTAALSVPSKPVPPPQAPPRATPAPAKHTATIPPPPPPPTVAQKAQAEKSAKEQQDAFAKAREEAERKAAADREKAKAEAESKMRADAEAKMRAEGDAKAREETEKRLAAEAEAKIKKAREEGERKAKEAEDTARREREELNRKLEAERKAREEAERKAKEEAKRLEEERRKLEEERKREEEQRAAQRKREEEERAARRKREEEEEQERRRKKREAEEEEERKRAAERAERKKREEEEEARERAEKEAKRRAKKQQEEEEEARERAEKDARRKAKEQEAKEREAKEQEAKEREAKEQEAKEKESADLPELDMSNVQPPPKAKASEPAPAKATGGFADSLLADLDSFTNRDEEERKEKEEAERKEKEAAAKRAREAEERRQKEEAERREQEEKERRKQEEKDRKAREKAEEREREEKEKQRIKDEEEKRKKEAEDREKKAKQDEQLTAKATSARAYDSEAAQRSRRDRMLGPKPKAGEAPGAPARAEKKGGLGTTIGLGVVGLLVVAAVVANFMPLGTADYERAASEALGQPVKIGSARLSVFTGLQIKFSGVAVGEEVKITEVRASPSIGALTGPKKEFSRIEIDGGRIEQRAIGEALFAKVKAENFSVRRLVARQVEFSGPLALPKGLEVEVNYDAQGAAQSAVVRGPEALVAKLSPKGSAIEVDLSAASFTLPFAPEISLSKFSLKGTATPKGLSVSEWDGALFNGTLSGTANVNWGDNWTVDGVITARNINAAVFAPALLSDGRGEGSGKFLMRGQPGKLAAGTRLDGTFTVSQGVLGSVDLSRAIQTQGKQTTGRTQFKEMNGQVVYDRGTVSLRNVTIGAGQLNAGASAEISQSGALSGRIIADVKVASQTHRATLSLGGNLKEPVVRN